jgi:hypothetical protein
MTVLTREEWGSLFSAEFYKAVPDLNPDWDIHQNIVNAELECWLADGGWELETPEEAVWESLSYWE